jgi:hypothetical protein
MKHKVIIFLSFIFFACSSNAEQSKSLFNLEVKRKLKWELTGLQNDILQLDLNIRNLKDDKIEIQGSLDAMKAWGEEEQKQKFEYYNNTVRLNSQLESVNNKLAESEKERLKLKADYFKVKRILSFAVGALLTLLFLRFGASWLIPLTGVYAPIATFAAPALSFGLGYFITKFIL